MDRIYMVEGDLIRFKFPYDPKLVTAVKLLKGRWYNQNDKSWSVPITKENLKPITDFIEHHAFTKREPEKQKKLTDAKVAEISNYLIENHNFSLVPRRYQLECLDYIIDKQRVIIGDDVGLGKTFEAIMGIEVERAFPCLVVTPSSVKYNWAARWEDWTGRTNISVIEGSKKDKNFWGADVVCVNYDLLGKMTEGEFNFKFPEIASIQWRSIICDESHFLKNKKSNRSHAVKRLIANIEIVYFLTGTAVMNRPSELINQLQLLGTFAIFGDWMYFVHRYCKAKRTRWGWDISGASNLMELHNKLQQTCYIRREKRDVLKELPPVTEQIFKVNISNKKKYHSAENDLLSYLRGEYGTEASVRAERAQELVLMNTLKQLSGEGKLKAIEQYLADWIEADNGKLLVFGTYRIVLEHLSDKFNATLISGGITAKQKFNIVNGFKSSSNPLLFANILSGGTGIDGIQEVCNNVLFLEFPWRPSDLEQAIGRISRQGQQFPVTVTYMMCPYTIDVDIWEMIQEKRVVTDAVNKGIVNESEGDSMRMLIKKFINKNT